MVTKDIELYGGELAVLSPSTKKMFPWDVSEIKDDKNVIGYKIAVPTNEFEEFKASLTMSLVETAFEYYFTKFLKGKLRDGVIESVIQNHIHAVQMPEYYFPLTMFILDEYFKNNSKINISTFIRFNMPGLVKEIKALSEIEAHMGGKFITMGNKIDDGHGGCQNGNLESIINEMITGYPSHGDIEANSRITVFEIDGEITVTNKDFKRITLEYFSQQTGVDTVFRTDDDNIDAAMTLLILAWEVFTPKSCVVYNSIQGQFRKDIENNIKVFNDNHEEQINLMFSKDNLPHLKPLV